MATKDWNGFKKNGDTYIPKDATAREGLQNKVDKVLGKGLSTNDYDNTAKAVVTTAQDNIKANTKLIKDTVGWSGKNKLPITHGNDNSPGIVFTQKTNNILHIEGTSTEGISYTLNPSVNEKYTAGKYKLSCVITGTVDTSAPMFTRTLYNADGTIKTGDFEVISANETSRTKIAEVTGTDYFGNNRIWIPANRTVNCDVELMIVDPDTLDMSYEPYFGSTAFPRSEQAVLGAKNLLPNNGGSGSNRSTVFTLNSDGTVTANTAASGGNASFKVYEGTLPAGRYILNGGLSDNLKIGLRLSSGYDWIAESASGDSAPFELSANTSYLVFMWVKEGVNPNNAVFKPMLRLASDTDDTYVPYAMTNKELTEKVGNKGTYDLYSIVSAITPSNGANPEFFIPWNNPDLNTPTFSFTIKIRNNSAWETLEQSGAINVQKVCKNGFLVNAVLTNALQTNSQFSFRIDGTITF